MTHDELLELMDEYSHWDDWKFYSALRVVVELHRPVKNWYDGNDEITDCKECQELLSDSVAYPCPTIQAIEKELK